MGNGSNINCRLVTCGSDWGWFIRRLGMLGTCEYHYDGISKDSNNTNNYSTMVIARKKSCGLGITTYSLLLAWYLRPLAPGKLTLAINSTGCNYHSISCTRTSQERASRNNTAFVYFKDFSRHLLTLQPAIRQQMNFKHLFRGDE